MSKQDVINSVRLHKAMNTIIESYDCIIIKTSMPNRQVITTKTDDIVGFIKSYYIDDFLNPRVIIASKCQDKLEGLIAALRIIDVETFVVQTKTVATEIGDWIRDNIWKA